MTVSLVVGIAENGVIGREGGLPWRLSTDLKRFKALTMGKPVIMGRKTWESIGKPLPGRANVVVTRNRSYEAEGAAVVGSLEDALKLARNRAPDGDVSVIGGAQIYVEALEMADRLDVTHILATVDGDTFFPRIDPDVWKIVSAEDVPAGERDDFPTRYIVYQRRDSRR